MVRSYVTPVCSSWVTWRCNETGPCDIWLERNNRI